MLAKRFHGIITNLASTDMDFTQLDAFLTSQMKKRQVMLSCKNKVNDVTV